MARSRSRDHPHWQGLFAHAFLGAVAGTLLLHPVTKAIYVAEWHGARSEVERLALAFTPSMLPMTFAFALLGGAIGLVFGLYHRLIAKQQRALGFLAAELGRTVSSLLAVGESEHTEFKESVRWDCQRERVSRDMEDAVARTIAGFLNHAGGSLLIGITDGGAVCGLDRDYATLHDRNRDGFERHIIGLVRSRFGGDVCPLVHVTFHRRDERDICRVIVEPADRPIYFQSAGTSRLFVRTGNSTRELDVREALEHVARRFTKQSSGAGVTVIATEPDPHMIEQ